MFFILYELAIDQVITGYPGRMHGYMREIQRTVVIKVIDTEVGS